MADINSDVTPPLIGVSLKGTLQLALIVVYVFV